MNVVVILVLVVIVLLVLLYLSHHKISEANKILLKVPLTLKSHKYGEEFEVEIISSEFGYPGKKTYWLQIILKFKWSLGDAKSESFLELWNSVLVNKFSNVTGSGLIKKYGRRGLRILIMKPKFGTTLVDIVNAIEENGFDVISPVI